MKKFKNGFTLAELLLVIAIIGVVSAMASVIAKKSTERAYNLYFYNGFVSLYDAISDTKMNEGKIEDNVLGDGTCNITISAPICHVNNLLGTTVYNNQPSFTVVTKNGIEYEFLGNNDWSHISMAVPQPKTRQNQNGRVYVALRLNTNSYGRERDEFLVPVSPRYLGANDMTAGRQYIHIGDRIDLLPTYLDDGIVGRMRRDIVNGGSEYSMRRYYTFDQAICSYINSNFDRNPRLGSVDGNRTILDCANVANIPAYNNGTIKFADPRYAR